METVGVILVILSLILVFGIVAGLYYSFKNKRQYASIKTYIITALIAVVVFFVGASNLPDVDDTAVADEANSEEIGSAAETESEPRTAEERLREAATTILGDGDRIGNVNFFDNDGRHFVLYEIDAKDNLSSEWIRKGILRDSAQLLKGMQERDYDGDVDLIWRFPLTDKKGNTENGKVLTMSISKETFADINFDNFDYNNLPDIASDYFEHPSFEQ